jgi:hypothetical protein
MVLRGADPLAAQINDRTSLLHGMRAATDPIARLQHNRRPPLLGQPPGGRQAGVAGPYHGCVENLLHAAGQVTAGVRTAAIVPSSAPQTRVAAAADQRREERRWARAFSGAALPLSRDRESVLASERSERRGSLRRHGAWRDRRSIPGRLLDVHPGDQSVAEAVDVDDASLLQHGSV